MLTVDEIRREMEKSGELPKSSCKRKEKEKIDMYRQIGEGLKEKRPLPEVIKQRWVWIARRAEIESALIERAGYNPESLKNMMLADLRKLAAEKVAVRQRKGHSPHLPNSGKKSPVKKVRRKVSAMLSAEAVRKESGRLYLAEIHTCPACGATLVFK